MAGKLQKSNRAKALDVLDVFAEYLENTGVNGGIDLEKYIRTLFRSWKRINSTFEAPF